MKKGDFFKFKKGMTVYQVPIRYWEPDDPIVPLEVIEHCGMDDGCVYARDANEQGAMYYPVRDRIFFKKENAEEARKLLTRLHELENDDGASAWMQITLDGIDAKHKTPNDLIESND